MRVKKLYSRIEIDVSYSVDLLIVEALEIVAKMRLRRLVFHSTVENYPPFLT